MADYDLAIIGGGLNGVSIARDAAGRGLRVILLEQDDLGSAASSASARLIHGDLACWSEGDFFASARRWLNATSGCAQHLIWCGRCAS
jgi:glycerol-3-phosphate dehydrogenase